MIGRIILGVLLGAVSGKAGAQPSAPPDRAAELLQLQFGSRSMKPPPDSMDGARATAIYKRFSDPASRGGQSQGAPPATSGSSP